MTRNYVTDAFVFSVKPLGEANRSVCLFTKNDGIVYATMYGGAKSHLRSLVSAWNCGKAYLYCKDANDLSKNVKLSDFDVQSYHLSFRENLYKNYAASLAAELIIKTKCAGSGEKCWFIAKGFFDGLEIAEGGECERGLVRFLWRYLALLGIQPDAEQCVSCGKNLASGNETQNALSYYAAEYDAVENGFLCRDCATDFDGKSPFSRNGLPFPHDSLSFAHDGLSFPRSTRESQSAGQMSRLALSEDAIRYLALLSSLSPKEARGIPLSLGALQETKRLVFFLAEQAAGAKLKSLESGIL